MATSLSCVNLFALGANCNSRPEVRLLARAFSHSPATLQCHTRKRWLLEFGLLHRKWSGGTFRSFSSEKFHFQLALGGQPAQVLDQMISPTLFD